MTGIPDFEDVEVVAVDIRVKNLGDGLSPAMAIAPIIAHHGDEVTFLVRGTIVDVAHPLHAKSGKLHRLQVIKAKSVTFTDDEGAKAILDRHDEKVAEAQEAARLAAEEAKGITRIPFTEGDENDPNAKPTRRNRKSKAAEHYDDDDPRKIDPRAFEKP